MLPSQQGGSNTGRPKPRTESNSLNQPSSTLPRDPQVGSSSQVNVDNSWYHSGGSSAQSTESSASSSSDMIGPSPTYYDPAVAAHQAESAGGYQQWVDSYGQPQQPQHQNMQAYQTTQHYQPYPQQQLPQQQFAYGQGSSYPTQYPQSNASLVPQHAMQQGGDADQYAQRQQQQQSHDPYNNFYTTTQPPAPGSHVPDTGYSYPTSTNSSSSYHTFNVAPQHPQPQGGHGQVATQGQSHGENVHQFPTNPGPFSADAFQAGAQPNRPTSNPTSVSPSSSNTWSEGTYSSGQTNFNNAGAGSSSSLSGAVPTNKNKPSTSQNPSPPQQARPPPATTETTPTRQKRPAPQESATASTSTRQASQANRPTKRKKPTRKDKEPAPAVQETTLYTFGDSDDDSDEEYQGGISVGMGGLGVASHGRSSRFRPGACTHCKKLKMKCDFPPGDNTCRRCKTSGHVCIVEGRKPRTAPNKREYLLAQIRQKDQIIESLLKQLHNPYIATPMSIASYRMATSPSDSDNKNVRAWLDRLESSVSSAGASAGPEAFKSLRGPAGDHDDDSDNEEPSSSAQPVDDDDQTVGPDADEEKLTSLPDTHVPLGLIANLSLTNSKQKSNKKEQKDPVAAEENLDDDDVGVANETYFMPGPATDLKVRATLIEQHSPPDILVHGLVTPEDVDKLFELFYTYINPFIHLLDPVLHTPSSTFTRCPFLFTVICAISSRYYSQKSEIYPIAMHFAKHSAANALIDGWKSVELCQAYILMSIYAVPARRWEEDRSWLYTGLAIRIATDLNLHQVPTTKPQNDKHEREILNRTRVWMICFNLDRSTATQFGKPSTIKEDYIMRNSKEWYKKSKSNLPYDIHLCGYSALLRIMTKAHEEIFSDPSSPSGLNKRVDFRTVTMQCDAELTSYHEEWNRRFTEECDSSDPGSALRCRLLPFLVEYHRLVLFSFAFQQAYQRGMQPGDQIYFTKCQESAKTVIRVMIDSLAPTDYMRYAPDGHFIFASFASAFLLKLLRKEFAHLLTKEQETEIFDLIGRLIQTLSSPKIAIDDRHTPKLYARFLAGLLSKHRREGTVHVGRLAPNAPTGSAGAPSYPPTSSGPSTTTFSVNQNFASSSTSTQQGGSYSGPLHDTPMYDYQSDATVPTGMGQINFGTDLGMAAFGGGISDEEMLATMQAIKSDSWWSNMMMPGFSWPESQSPSSNGSSPQPTSSAGYSSPSPPRPYTDSYIPSSHGYHSGVGLYQPVPTA